MNKKLNKSKHLVPVGTHIPSADKITLQAIAESENKSVYIVLQELIKAKIDSFEESIESDKGPSDIASEDDSDLLS